MLLSKSLSNLVDHKLLKIDDYICAPHMYFGSNVATCKDTFPSTRSYKGLLTRQQHQQGFDSATLHTKTAIIHFGGNIISQANDDAAAVSEDDVDGECTRPPSPSRCL